MSLNDFISFMAQGHVSLVVLCLLIGILFEQLKRQETWNWDEFVAGSLLGFVLFQSLYAGAYFQWHVAVAVTATFILVGAALLAIPPGTIKPDFTRLGQTGAVQSTVAFAGLCAGTLLRLSSATPEGITMGLGWLNLAACGFVIPVVCFNTAVVLPEIVKSCTRHLHGALFGGPGYPSREERKRERERQRELRQQALEEYRKENNLCPRCGRDLQPYRFEWRYSSGSSGSKIVLRCPVCQGTDTTR